MTPATPIFLADAALGRLAIWLRLLGYDTAYERCSGDALLLQRARAEGRILLTRNRRVFRRRDLPPCLLIAADDFRQQVRDVLGHFGLDPADRFLSRCSRCNAPLVPLERHAAWAAVPAYVCATQTTFVRCPCCKRVYWPATHVDRMRRELAALRS